ncbi:hypothetical protein BS78_K092800 [Paspalum vaginatum]|uniref:Uncharacterized protein n=1 Tax=Paspalum vaginatum TaxID=158149 RepID=A0A9W8CFW8_9POAL|nr:hypothetical protein BS78_K092800 [Paspalum vaginatum]KAJ1257350.1 hypothetical protein BS78_K092800 [Paspalum vaginatum]KAJ1257351.1 hypothetical protein BS78_K092800 [Paspalum vaginatum]
MVCSTTSKRKASAIHIRNMIFALMRIPLCRNDFPPLRYLPISAPSARSLSLTSASLKLLHPCVSQSANPWWRRADWLAAAAQRDAGKCKPAGQQVHMPWHSASWQPQWVTGRTCCTLRAAACAMGPPPDSRRRPAPLSVFPHRDSASVNLLSPCRRPGQVLD